MSLASLVIPYILSLWLMDPSVDILRELQLIDEIVILGNGVKGTAVIFRFSWKGKNR
jgi:hypothetical protein